ncbi:alpha-L-fucosidase [soil metagenome]
MFGFLPLLLAASVLPAQTRTPLLASWEGLKYGMFIHYGMSTFDQAEINDGKSAPSVYAPTALDVRQWVHVAKEAGMKYAVLTAKHTAGFCNWPSGDYDVTLSPNKTDVVAAFMKACKEEGIKPGIYYCVLDGHNEGRVAWEDPITPEYWALIKKHITQLHTRYPGIFEQWIDIPGKLSPEQRSELYGLVKKFSPNCLVLMNRSEWTTPGLNVLPGAWPTDLVVGERNPPPAKHNPHMKYEGKDYYMPLECCDCLTENWFWTNGDQPRSVRRLYQMYNNAVGRGANLLLDVAPDQTGQIPAQSVKRLMELKHAIAHPEMMPVALSKLGKVSASNVYKGDPAFGAEMAVDDNDASRWATDDDQHSAWLEVDLGTAKKVKKCVIAEAYPGRIQTFELQVRVPGAWKTFYRGTTVGDELEVSFDPIEGKEFRLNILDSKIGPTIKEFQLY